MLRDKPWAKEDILTKHTYVLRSLTKEDRNYMGSAWDYPIIYSLWHMDLGDWTEDEQKDTKIALEYKW